MDRLCFCLCSSGPRSHRSDQLVSLDLIILGRNIACENHELEELRVITSNSSIASNVWHETLDILQWGDSGVRTIVAGLHASHTVLDLAASHQTFGPF